MDNKAQRLYPDRSSTRKTSKQDCKGMQESKSAASCLKNRVGVIWDFGDASGNQEPRRVPLQKKYIVRLTESERNTLRDVIKKLSGSSQKVRRAQILLKADADGPAWPDAVIVDAFSCRTRTVESIRERFVERAASSRR